MHDLVLCVHVLAGAAWFGAMLYSLFVVQPRARRFFRREDAFEEFAATLAAGARWKVLSGCGLIAGTGVGLLLCAGPLTEFAKQWLKAKSVFFGMAVTIFCYVSWRLWPARVLAAPSEVLSVQKRFRTWAAVLICLVGLCFVCALIGGHGAR